MTHEAPLNGIDLATRLKYLKQRKAPQHEQSDQDPLQALLAPGMTWEEVAQKHHLKIPQAQGIIQEYLKSEEYGWLKGKVGGGKLLMEKHRGTILAAEQFHGDLVTYAHIPHEVQPFYDHESDSSFFSNPVKLDLRAAKEGIEILGENLVRTIGDGNLTAHALGFYLHCWDRTAQTIMKLLREENVVTHKYFGEYGINPTLLAQPIE